MLYNVIIMKYICKNDMHNGNMLLHQKFVYMIHWIAIKIFSFILLAEKKVLYYFTQKLPPKMVVKQKKELVLECMLSDPRPHVKWLKDGEPIEVS